MRKLFVFFVIIMISSLCCAQGRLEKYSIEITRSDDTSVFVDAEIADTDAVRMRGFMERKNIPDGTGMIFVFEKDQILSFWMKNTPTPLSIAYIDSRGVIRDIFDMTPYSLASVVSRSSCRYALEVPQGWFEKEGISAGDKISLDFLKLCFKH